MSNNLNLPALQDDKSSAIDSLSSSNNAYLPYVALQTAGSRLCKSGKFPINHYALVKDKDPIDLGETVDVFVVGLRPMAMDFSGDTPVVSNHPDFDSDNQATGIFKTIQDKASQKDSNCQFGVEFLIYLPDQKTYAKLFLGSASARREIPNLKARYGEAATLSSKYIDTGKYQWQAIEVIPCSAVLEAPEDAEETQRIAKEFSNPPRPEVKEEAPAPSNDR